MAFEIIGIVLGLIAISSSIYFNKQQQKQDKNLTKLTKALPSIIGKVVGQIEFAQDKLNRKM